MDATEIVVVMDRSGSMMDLKEEAEDGLAEFIKGQKASDKPARFTYARFDEEYEVIVNRLEIEAVSDSFVLEPRGMTALHDAIGMSINRLRTALDSEDDPADKVVMLIITDGKENASKEYKFKIKEMMEEAQTKWGWEIIFIGANQDAVAEGGKMGLSASKAVDFDAKTRGSLRRGLAVSGAKLASYREDGDAAVMSYTEKDKADILHAVDTSDSIGD